MIHRFWCGEDDPPYPIIDRYVQSSYRVTDWIIDDLPDWVTELAYDTSSHLSNQSDVPRHLSNIVRLYILHTQGGIWLDHDVIPLTNLESLTFPYIGSFGAIHDPLWPCVMAFHPNHPMISTALDRLRTSPTGSTSPDLSGSALLASVLTQDVQLYNLSCDAMGQPLKGLPFAFHLSATSNPRPSHKAVLT